MTAASKSFLKPLIGMRLTREPMSAFWYQVTPLFDKTQGNVARESAQQQQDLCVRMLRPPAAFDIKLDSRPMMPLNNLRLSEYF